MQLKRFLSYILIAAFLTACGSPQPAQAATNAKNIEFLLSQVRQVSGPLSGGKVYAYETGTLTPKTIWLDRGKVTQAANPYTLDSNGTAQLFGDGLYRIIIKTSAGVTVYDRSGLAYKDASGLAYDVADYGSLAAVVAAIGITPATLQYSTDQTLAANLVVPATLELMPLNGAVINHGTYTISYAGSTARWPVTQIFNGTGAVTGFKGIAHPEWFTTGTTSGFQAANNALTGGGVIQYTGSYTNSTPIVLSAGVKIRGIGKLAGGITYTGTGDAVQSKWTINGSTAAYTGIDQARIVCTNGANAGAGFAEVAGTYVEITDSFISGFKYGIIHDQTEVSRIEGNTLTGNTTAEVWFLDDDSYTATASPGFTNVVSVKNNSFNSISTAVNFLLDGNTTINIEGNNFNGGLKGLRVKTTSGLRVVGNFFENQVGHALSFEAGATGGSGVASRSEGFIVEGNTFGTTGAQEVQIYISEAYNGVIRKNKFAGATIAAIAFAASSKTSGIEIYGNTKFWNTDTPFISADAAAYAQNSITQLADTNGDGVAAPGAANVTPGSMESIVKGSVIWCVNLGGTNGELVTVDSVSGGLFTATFASTKSAGFLIRGVRNPTTVDAVAIQTLTYGTSIATNAATGTIFIIPITNGTAFTIANPTNPATGQQIAYRFVNTSGGAVGTVSWGAAFKTSAATATPSTGFSREIGFFFDGTYWRQRYTTGDVAN